MKNTVTKKEKLFLIVTKSNWGGAQRYVFDLATKLPKEMYEISVVCGGNGELVRKLNENKIRVINIESLERDIGLFKEINVFLQLHKLFKKESPDIIHLNSSKIGGVGALAGRLVGVKKIVFTAHGWAFNETTRNIFSRIIIKLLSRLTIFLCHEVIAVSFFDAGQISSKKVSTIHNGIDNIDFKERDTARRELLTDIGDNIDENKIWIGAIGELHKNKGFEYLIDSLSRPQLDTKDFICVIIGEGEERKNLEDLIKEKKLENTVFLVGNDGKKLTKASSYLKAFQIYAMPSIKEGLPYVLLEAGLAHNAVVASNVGGIPEIVENNLSGLLVNPKDSSSFAHAINVLKNKDEIAKFGEKLNEKIIKNFPTENMVNLTLKIYKYAKI